MEVLLVLWSGSVLVEKHKYKGCEFSYASFVVAIGEDVGLFSDLLVDCLHQRMISWKRGCCMIFKKI